MSRSIATRRRLVRRMIDAVPIQSQGELVDLLEQDGYHVTQATVSRDLDAIGAVKVRGDNGGLRYEVPAAIEATVGSATEMARIIDEFVTDMQPSLNQLVIRTRPGAAHVVAGAIDRAQLDGVLGTVAGDDTLLLVAKEEQGGRGLLAELDRIGVQR